MKFPLIRQGEGPAAAFARLVEEREREQRKISQIIRETSAAVDAPIDSKSYRQKLPGDERALRGIPAIGRGVAGAIPGTRPGNDLS